MLKAEESYDSKMADEMRAVQDVPRPQGRFGSDAWGTQYRLLAVAGDHLCSNHLIMTCESASGSKVCDYENLDLHGQILHHRKKGHILNLNRAV